MRCVALYLASRWQFLVHLSNLLLWMLHRVPGSLCRLILFLLSTDFFAGNCPFTAGLHNELLLQVVAYGVACGRVVVMVGDFELAATVARVISHPETSFMQLLLYSLNIL